MQTQEDMASSRQTRGKAQQQRGAITESLRKMKQGLQRKGEQLVVRLQAK